MNRPPVIGLIGATDSAGLSGLSADLCTVQRLGGHAALVVTATTAQTPAAVHAVHPMELTALQGQLAALSAMDCQAVKVGLVPESALPAVQAWLRDFKGPKVLDPVLTSSSGHALGSRPDLLRSLLPMVDVVTPNVPEASALTGLTLHTTEDLLHAARHLTPRGGAVYLKGGHLIAPGLADWSPDLLLRSEPHPPAWLVQPRRPYPWQRGTGCTLAAALATGLALGETLEDAATLANAYVQQGLRQGYPVVPTIGPIARLGPPTEFSDFPRIVDHLSWLSLPPFPDCGPEPLGLYPVVDSLDWIRRLLPLGVTTLQLRIKARMARSASPDDKCADLCRPDSLDPTLAVAIRLARSSDCRLFINDHWSAAIQHGAYGVHLGQEDLQTANLGALAQSGLRLGISTHGEFEWCRAAALRPSYIALGAVFPTGTKPARVIGTERLHRWVETLSPRFALTAIGGVTLDNLSTVLCPGLRSVAVVTAITRAADPARAVQHFQSVLKDR